jgi:hypothetical protein
LISPSHGLGFILTLESSEYTLVTIAIMNKFIKKSPDETQIKFNLEHAPTHNVCGWKHCQKMANDLKILMKEAVKNCNFEKAEELKNTRNIWQACSDLEASLLEKCS